ncbi:transcription initiation factor TFIID subunit 5-like isoform X2 [Humulus lupulus]|uniref:transcription initiation factor TFIID subunit 5-like isoform X2 n=1 Tax=Humulus lupulus TaxID=3486 RepID=UPI002B410AEF|nr:transcription initiation factor TFIID subunit 5-like isoform X2 [Humulus lupulus]
MSKPLLMIASNIRILESVRQQYKKTHDLLSSQYSYELLLQFLHKSQSTTVLGIINEHINFQVSPGQPNSISDDAEAVTLTGSSQDAVSQINQKEIHWGLLEDSLEERLEKTGGLLSDSEKAEGETKESEWEENKKRSAEGGKQGSSVKKLKKDKATGATGKATRPETNIVTMAPRVKPELPLPTILNMSILVTCSETYLSMKRIWT